MSHATGNGTLAVSVWLRLLKAHALLLREARRHVPEGLTLAQFDVLAQLHRRSEGMTSRELTRELLVTAGNLTGIVERLVRLGLVERRPVPEDRRAVRVRLTPKGRLLMQRAIPRHAREIESAMAAVPNTVLARLRPLLGRLGSALEGGPGGRGAGSVSGPAVPPALGRDASLRRARAMKLGVPGGRGTGAIDRRQA